MRSIVGPTCAVLLIGLAAAGAAGGATAQRSVTLHLVEKSVGWSNDSPYSDDTLHLIWP